MKIANYSLTMQASHDRSQKSSVKENLRIWIDSPAPNSASASPQVTLSLAARQKQGIYFKNHVKDKYRQNILTDSFKK